ncbi:GNAT family N-acetyltransferase [Aeromicrobium ginsengisoli]|uniref:GNAT family N-acetyltransferase n=1 Tax=Aeromicrobium ginsengisoli TaxID=363867 RepID=A0A5M4FIQ5_9ACTN|nr:GNAT family protein [Aeromicrobium ginsengisoli]KAA1399941.1 GNAT family N-acetyltransferase [Aeromicrobium ginsengisoli]
MGHAQPLIERNGVRLRDFRPEDANLVISASTDPLIPLITTVPTTPDAAGAQAYIARQRTRQPSGVGYAFAIARPPDDVAVGYIGLTFREDGRASVGYWIGPEHRGHGFAASALSTLAEWAIADLSIPRLELYVERWNEASIRTAEKAGFQREGLMRSWQLVGETRRDMWMYSRIGDG